MNEVIVHPFWTGTRSCKTCQNRESWVNNCFVEVQRCPLTIVEAQALHVQVHQFGACIFWKKSYENHCWNCKNDVSSRFCRKSPTPNMGYVCLYCGKDLSQYKGVKVNCYI